jgi:hypothetical protein
MPAFSRGRHADEAPLSVDAPDQDGPARAVHVDHFYLRRQAPDWLGTIAFALCAMIAHRLGYRHISLIAGGGRGHDPRMIGYFFWPKLGFDAPLDADETADLPQLAMCRTVQDVLAIDEAWWRQNSSQRWMEAFMYSWRDMIRVVCMVLMNVIPVVATIFGAAYAVQASYGIGFHKSVYLWIPVVGNIVAVLVIPYVGNLSDRIGRKLPVAVGAIGSGLLSYGYLYAISIRNVPLAFIMSLLMWGIVYQGYNAVFSSFYPELFPTRSRVWVEFTHDLLEGEIFGGSSPPSPGGAKSQVCFVKSERP